MSQNYRCHRKLPGKIDGITKAGVHVLSAGGAMDVRGIARQESTALAEMRRHAMMHMMGQKPIDLPDLQLEMRDCSTGQAPSQPAL